VPAVVPPLAPFRVKAHGQVHVAVEVMNGNPPEGVAFGIEILKIVYPLLPPVPDLILLEAAR